MVGQQGMKRKEEITDILNRILEQATRTREGFTPQVVERFYDEGARNREERLRQQMREATPVRQSAVTRRSEEQRAEISPHMRQRGIEAAVDLGERLELAASGRKISLREWVTG
jgi:hypothetical protein